MMYEVVGMWLMSLPGEVLEREVEVEGKGRNKVEVYLKYLLISGLGDGEMRTEVEEMVSRVGERRNSLDCECAPISNLSSLLSLSLSECMEWTAQERAKARGTSVLLSLATLSKAAIQPYIDLILHTAIPAYTHTQDPHLRHLYIDCVAEITRNCEGSVLLNALLIRLTEDLVSHDQRTTILVRTI